MAADDDIDGPLASALNRPPLDGFDITLNSAYEPRARRVGVDPEAGDASVTVTAPMRTTASASTPAAVEFLVRIRYFPLASGVG